MEFLLDDDQVALRDELRRSLAGRADHDRLRAAIDLPGAVDRDLWRSLADTGVFALVLPEDDGGVGLGWADATIVFEELGRAAVPGPLVATFLAAGCLGGVAAGERVVGAIEPAAPAFVEHLDALDDLLVVDAGGVMRVDPASLTGDRLAPLDPLTPIHLVDRLPADAPALDGAPAPEVWRLRSALLSAALQVGLGAAATDLAVAYAKDRHQFGKPIGSFQALKHLLADAQTGIEVSRAAVQAAGCLVEELGEGGEAARAVASARIVAARAARQAATTCVQVHGGMGYTWEVDAHLLLKRVLVLDQAVGSVDEAVDARVDALA